MSDFNSDIFQFWGKADEHKILPAVCHMLDVAFVARAIILKLAAQERAILLKPFLSIEGVDEDTAIAMVVLLIALHDIGKITPGFQYKLQDRVKDLFDTEVYCQKGADETQHGTSGYEILLNWATKTGQNRYAVKPLVSSVASHHGEFVTGSNNGRFWGRKSAWETIQTHAINWLLDYFQVDVSQLCEIDDELLTPIWYAYMAGLCSVSDWIGSDPYHFTYISAEAYFSDIALRIDAAQRLADTLSIKHIKAAQSIIEFDKVFGFKPNALQQSILASLNSQGQPWLTVIESGMGSGKTEAALILADHFIRNLDHSGLYVAMPSQATANQLYKRTLKFLQNESLGYKDIETHLKHSNAEFNPAYEDLLLFSIEDLNEQNSVKANLWFTAKKRGLLAGASVGTIDQLLMAAMLYKHNFVRLFAIANKTVILDEVHALDYFQLSLLKNTLRWMAKLKVRVIILSATLPKLMLRELVQAYGQEFGNTIKLKEAAYPRLTTYSGGQLATSVQVKECADTDKLASPPKKFWVQLHKTTPQQCVEQMASDVLARVKEAGCGVFVCILNTVNAAQALSEIVLEYCDQKKSQNTQCLVFHARYPIGNRLAIEDMVEYLVGNNPRDRKAVNPNRPVKDQCLILIGSQVLEQSLDYDACEMFTQVAPSDLIMQRLGRVWRHQINNPVRSELINSPRLNVYLPGLSEIPEDYAKWLGYADIKIYPPHILAVTTRLLWEAAASSKQNNGFELDLDEEVDDWVNNVYTDIEQQVDWLDQEQEKAFEFELEKKLVYRLANDMMFDADQEDVSDLLDYLNDQFDDEDLVLSTRLASLSVQIILLIQNEDGLLVPITEYQPYLQQCQTPMRENAPYEAINWRADKRFNKNDIGRLKQSLVKLSHADWVEHFREIESNWQFNFVAKDVWQRTSQLHSCVPVILDQYFTYSVTSIGTLKLDPVLGLKVEKCRSSHNHSKR
ncbi:MULTISPECIES: CRISPR-associated helicase Cas3' [unclassified Pseudoalteromonas]|uniref:CRISPR-associated helicase Cas3' n=1 Tax=unclassified Pseudoalteromonas TaxID=194690 RepID=UPI001F1A2B13|nr:MULTISPECIES: CRISPR-associated helicase Cas3' [unclassified Pseudoalteromonas]MCF2828510.1 CRISPR-associated helicase Cas3' [Pseudoalteromonas sp. OF5H-5]MCF2832398.1 CRISPR-associated helicase Cas3' [Pseudoalteromonas sp. DL2-H6]MCF2924886.1 CRISPR-associated helicase Cas3' [Pseudoalteromonas sp. DL2-H1]